MKRQNPDKDQGFVTNRRRMSSGVKVGATGFEPATFWPPAKRANQAALRPEQAKEIVVQLDRFANWLRLDFVG